METTIAALLASGKGILAADESLPTIGERFAALDIPSIAESHRDYRELLFTTPGLSEAISGDAPWKLSLSFGRALQSAAMKSWKGSPENIVAAQEALLHRAQCNSAAVEGRYAAEMESNGSR